MKYLLIGLLLLLGTPSFAAVTNDLVISDLGSQMIPTDYGDVNLTIAHFINTPKWNGEGDPPRLRGPCD